MAHLYWAREPQRLCSEQLRHGLFHKVLALLSGQKDFASFSQSADERHLLAAVPQLQGIHPGQQRAGKNGHRTQRREFIPHMASTLLLTFLLHRRCSLCWPLIGCRSRLTGAGSPPRSCCWTEHPERSYVTSCCCCPSPPSPRPLDPGTSGWALRWTNRMGS